MKPALLLLYWGALLGLTMFQFAARVGVHQPEAAARASAQLFITYSAILIPVVSSLMLVWVVWSRQRLLRVWSKNDRGFYPEVAFITVMVVAGWAIIFLSLPIGLAAIEWGVIVRLLDKIEDGNTAYVHPY